MGVCDLGCVSLKCLNDDIYELEKVAGSVSGKCKTLKQAEAAAALGDCVNERLKDIYNNNKKNKNKKEK